MNVVVLEECSCQGRPRWGSGQRGWQGPTSQMGKRTNKQTTNMKYCTCPSARELICLLTSRALQGRAAPCAKTNPEMPPFKLYLPLGTPPRGGKLEPLPYCGDRVRVQGVGWGGSRSLIRGFLTSQSRRAGEPCWGRWVAAERGLPMLCRLTRHRGTDLHPEDCSGQPGAGGWGSPSLCTQRAKPWP